MFKQLNNDIVMRVRFEGCEKMSSSIFCDVSDLLEEVQKRIAVLER